MVFQHEGLPYSLILGREISVCNNLSKHLEAIYKQNVDCIITPLFHPSFPRDKESIEEETDPLAKADTLIPFDIWMKHVVGLLSQDIDLDSQYEHIRSRSKFYLKQELNYAVHLGIEGLIIPGPTKKSDNYARVINKVRLYT